MKAVVVSKPGDVSVLEIKEVATPKMKLGWNLIKVLGFGINRSEIFTRQGYSPSVTFPRILGIECVGEIVESNQFEVGTKIISFMNEMGRAYDGSYAEYTLLKDENIYPISIDFPIEKLAALPESYYTAYGSFKNLNIQPQDKVLVRGASSALGIAFLKLVKAKYPDLYIVGSSRNLNKKEMLLKEGFDDLILDIDGILNTNQCFDKILDLIGPFSIKDSISHLNEFGIICSSGQLGKQWTLMDFDPIMELKNNTYLTTFYSGNVNSEKINEMIQFIQKYQVEIAISKVYSLDQIQEAHHFIEQADFYGKVVIIDK